MYYHLNGPGPFKFSGVRSKFITQCILYCFFVTFVEFSDGYDLHGFMKAGKSYRRKLPFGVKTTSLCNAALHNVFTVSSALVLGYFK